MNKRNTHIDWRIFRKAAGNQLTNEEQLLLDTWLNEDASRKIYFEKALKYYAETDTDEDIEYEPAFNEFVNRNEQKKRNYLRFTQIAASVIILVACGWLAYVVTTAESYQTLSDAEPIKAKEGQVELILSSGEKILLEKEEEHQIEESEGVITKKEGVVDYLAFKNKEQRFPRYNTVNIPRGTNFKLVLSDSTVVHLNAESSITYPLKFADNIREVSIAGEAYFNVAPNQKKPFIVKANNTKIEVLGTEFNVNAYKKEEGIYTTLIEGSVAVENEFGKTVVIKPNEQAITSFSADIAVKNVNINHIVDWRAGMLDFEDEPLGDILDELARWYDFKVFYESEDLQNYQFTGGIDRYEDVKKLLKLFEMTKSVKFYVKKNVLLVKKAE